MLRRLAALAPIVLFACKQSGSKPPALSPEVAVGAIVVGGTGLDQPVGEDGRRIAVGFGASGYLVVWTQPGGATYDDLWGARMSASGELVGNPFPISTAAGDQGAPAVAFDGQNWLVAFEDHRSGPYLNIYAARVGADGTVLDPNGIPIATQVDHQQRPAVAFDGTNYLVAWADHRSGTNWDVYASRVSRDGTVLDGDGFAVSAAGGHQLNPTVAFDGTNYLVAWQDLRSGKYDIYCARVTQSGAVLDAAGIPVSTAPYDQTVPAAVFDGHEFVVAWQDLRGGVTPDVVAARVGSDGTLLDGSGIAVTSAAGSQTAPAAAFDGAYTVVLWVDGSAVPSSVRGARLDSTGTVLDASPFSIADAGSYVGVASDAAGRALVAYVVPADDSARLRTRAMTDWAVLTVQKDGKGGGTVTSSPDGISCGDACSSRFDAPTPVSLTAAPDGDSAFGGWSGACTGTASCSVTIDAAKSVTATFLPLYRVTVALGSGVPGTITSDPAGIDCGGACSFRWVEGTRVRLAAKGIPGASVFSTWAGDCAAGAAGDPAVAECVLDAPKSVTATFLPAVTITLTSSGMGQGTVAAGTTTCPSGAVCSADVIAGSTATVAAAPAAGSILKSWTGCTAVAGAPATCTVSATMPRYVSARFEPSSFSLTASTTGAGAGTITGAGLACATGAGDGCTSAIDNPPNTSSYTTLTLTAAPSPGSAFKGWSGCLAVTGAPSTCTVTMNFAKMVSARFEPSTFPLTASFTGPGAGTITGAGLACTTGSPDGCTAAVENPGNSYGYTTVTITAAPSPGSAFKSWIGCSAVAGTPNACTVLVNMAKNVSARFEPSTFPLTAMVTGTGAGTIGGAGLACTPAGDGCAAAVENPNNSSGYTTVTLTATPSAGSSFKSWVGCIAVSGTPNACTVLVNMAKSVSARFEPSTFPLAAMVTGTGAGTIGGAGLACTPVGDGCTAAVENPNNSSGYTTVTLTATPTAGSSFKSWIGCTAVSGTPNACTVLVNSAKNVSARFEPSTFPLGAAATGTGSGTITGAGLACTASGDGCTAAVENPNNTSSYGTLTLTATPGDGSVFKSWVGCTPVPGTPNACTLFVNSAKYVSARFEPSTLPLTANTTGTGAGTIGGAGLSCTTGSADGCTAAVPNPANTSAYNTVTLTATASDGSVFKSWIGCTAVVDTPNACTVLVSMARFVSARFEPSTLPLTATTTGTGAGTISGAGLSCTTGSADGCTAAVDNPPNTTGYTTVTLAATAAPGSVFKSWSGCAPVAGAPETCTVSVSMAKFVSARFEPSTMPLTVIWSGFGAGTVAGGGISCTSGSGDGCSAAIVNPADTTNYTTVTLTATADSASLFNGWVGCAPLVDAPQSCTVIMSLARTVTVKFVLR